MVEVVGVVDMWVSYMVVGVVDMWVSNMVVGVMDVWVSMVGMCVEIMGASRG